MEKQDAKALLNKYLDGTATPEERVLVERWYLEQAGKQPMPEGRADPEAEEQILWARISENLPARPLVRKLRPRRWLVAASVLLLISAAAYLAFHQKPAVPGNLAKNDVAPFSKQAILKTGHGKTLLLDSNKTGTLAQYAHTRIRQSGGEQIAYSGSVEQAEALVYDTLQVPAGGKPYHLQLMDGSAIIVNVASSLRFPENFKGGKRDAELLSGEAYFSVVHNPKSPFTLKAKGQLIEDIGTEFNVNTYADEPDSRTTLVSGAVSVNHKVLAPGQQAIVTPASLVIATADIEQTTAWKNGYFRFNGENIQAVMRELARWYNIEVSYEGKISTEGYYIKVARSKNISEVLKALERTNSVHFKIEGRRVTVSSKK